MDVIPSRISTCINFVQKEKAPSSICVIVDGIIRYSSDLQFAKASQPMAVTDEGKVREVSPHP